MLQNSLNFFCSFSERPRPMTETSILMSEDPEETQVSFMPLWETTFH